MTDPIYLSLCTRFCVTMCCKLQQMCIEVVQETVTHMKLDFFGLIATLCQSAVGGIKTLH